jgi:hypothetical protein
LLREEQPNSKKGREMKLSAVLGLAIVDPDQFSLRAPFPEGLPAPN